MSIRKSKKRRGCRCKRKGFFFLFAAFFILFSPSLYAFNRTWDGGGATNNWSEAANWSSNRLPGSGDTATFSNSSGKDAVIDTAVSVNKLQINSNYTGVITQAEILAVGSGGFFQGGGTFAGAGQDITVDGALRIVGGAFTSTSGALTVAGNLLLTGGTFTHNLGIVILAGTGQTITGPFTFFNLTKTVGSADTLTLPAESTVTIVGTMTLKGADGRPLSLVSSAAGTQAVIDPQGTREVEYLNVADSNNQNSLVISCFTDCTDSGNNTNWIFAPVAENDDDNSGGDSGGDIADNNGDSGGSTTGGDGDTGDDGGGTTGGEDADSVEELTANAGPDRTVVAGRTLSLDGSGSTGVARYLWSIFSGIGVLEDAEEVTARLSFPSSAETGDVVVQLMVENDGGEVQTDRVTIHVMALMAAGETLDEPLVGIFGGTPFYEEIGDEGRIILVFGDVSILLPSEVEEYYLSVAGDRYLIVGIPSASEAGEVYFSTQPIDDLTGEVDLELLPTSAVASADFIGTAPAISPSASAEDPGFIAVTGETAGDLFGKYLAVGDLDGDGVDEILVSAPNDSADGSTGGSVFIYSADYSLSGIVEGSAEFPLSSVLSADFLDDSADDIFFGPDNPGLNPVLRRNDFSPSVAAAANGFMATGGDIVDESVSAASSVAGTVVESVSDQLFTAAVFGDVNGDEEPDLVLTTTSGVATDGGEVLIYFGKQEPTDVMTDNDADVVISGGGSATGGDSSTGFGSMVAVGDVTGDGLSDIIVGAPTAEGGKGGIHVIFGREAWASSLNLDDDSSVIFFAGEEEGDSIGSDLLAADGDGDGVSEIYTIKGEKTVYRISWMGEPANGGDDGNDEETSGLGPGGFGCSLNVRESPSDPRWMILLACFFSGLLLPLRLYAR